MAEGCRARRSADHRASCSRREAIGLAAAAVALASCNPPVVREPGREGAAVRLANRSTLLAANPAGSGALSIQSLANRSSGFEWLGHGQSFAPLFRSDTAAEAAWRAQPFNTASDALAIHATTQDGLEASLEIVGFEDTGAFRWQQVYRNHGSTSVRRVREAGAFELTLDASVGTLVVHCLRRDGDYVREALPLNDRVEVRGGEWNKPGHAGLVVLEARSHAEFLVVGIQQERGWTFSLERTGDGRARLRVDIGDMAVDLEPGQSLESPPLFVGAAGGSLEEAVNLSLGHLRTRIMPKPLEGTPWVSYDIWSTDRSDVETRILDEIAFAARLGVELFYLDAAWYRNSSVRGTGDWGKGLGSYVEDRAKFPRGLRYLSDRVHAAGMKFGLWVGPNVVDVALVPGEIPESWLAQVDGKRNELSIDGWENKLVQACLGCSEYAHHLKTELTRLVRDYGLDWVKWDNSGIPGSPARCTRADHGHAAGDGSAAALRNEYAIFAHLHNSFPQLTLEQCGYGSRLDYGRAAYIRANWCSDATFPSERVRSNAMACATVYPASCNASWIVREDQGLFSQEETHRIDSGIRSRMLGLFGVGTLNGQMSQRASLYPPRVIDRLVYQISQYKQFRHLLSQQVSFPFAPYGQNAQGWQAVQFTDDAGLEAIVLCFRGSGTQADARLSISRLRANSHYRVHRVDAGTDERLSGEQLLQSGLLVRIDATDGSEIVRLKAVG